ncbi:MAG: calcium-binding protein [Solirubrobacterales bacterium]|nr:calcium-binding protein [Solirubrobacterales bacterium]
MRKMIVVGLLALTGLLLAFAPASQAIRKATHKGWPEINGALIINLGSSNRPIDARPGKDPFQGTDPAYRCRQDKKNNLCFIKAGACRARGQLCAAPPVMPFGSRKHHELLGAGGNDVIHAGDAGDVIWGDHRYPENPVTQRDRLFGGPGPDFIYASHGHNIIHTGGGRDAVLARYGRGEIHCDSSSTVVNLSRRSKKRYKLFGCRKITLKPVGTQQFPG